MNLECVKKNIEPYDVITADEAFMTGTPFCLLPVTSLNGIQIGEGRMGRVTKMLLDRWSENVGVDIEEQIKRWDAEDVSIISNAPSPYIFKSK